MKKRVIPDQLRAPIVIVAPTLGKLRELRAAEELKASDLAHFLAAAQFDPAYRGANAVTIPVEVVTMIGEHLIAPAGWVKEVNAARVQAARLQAAEWQSQADEVWGRHPTWSKFAVAKKIDPNKVNTIRLKIARPK